MSALYPLKFRAIFKPKIWGGRKLHTHLGKNFYPHPHCGESWEISAAAPDDSVIVNGAHAGRTLSWILNTHRAELVGNAVYERFGNSFPLLVKFIDAKDDLSIQVHPDDRLAQARHGCSGKTEMWYVVQADEGATLVAGFNRHIDADVYLQKFGNGQQDDILNKVRAEAGDVFFLPAGRVHTIGKGLLIAEIQQASDVTYRLHDFDRGRRLHTEEALAALDFSFHEESKSAYPRTKNEAVKLVECEHFTTNILDFDRPLARHYSADSFVIHVCVAGWYELDDLRVNVGDCVLIPASRKHIQLRTPVGAKVLESYIDERLYRRAGS